MIDFYHFIQPFLSWGKTGQIAHVSSPSSGIEKKTIFARHTKMRRLVDSGWGADAKTLRTAALYAVYLTAEYCAPPGVATFTLAASTVS